MRKLLWVGAFLGVVLLGWLLDALFAGEERAVAKTLERMVEGIERQEIDLVLAPLDPAFRFTSQKAVVGQGGVERVRSRIEEVWSRVAWMEFVNRRWEIQVDGERASAEIRGNAKFETRGSGTFAIYKYRATVSFEKKESAWKVVGIEVHELEPGIL